MAANLSVQIVHSDPGTELVQPCLFCVHGQGQFQFRKSSSIIEDVFGIDVTLLSEVPEADQLFCSDCKTKLEQIKAFRLQVQQMYFQMCTIYKKKTKLQEALTEVVPEAQLSFSLPSAVLTVSSDQENKDWDPENKNPSVTKPPSFLVTLNVHLQEGSSKKSVALQIINSQLDVRPSFSSPLDGLFGRTSNHGNSVKNVPSEHEEESSTEAEEATLTESPTKEKLPSCVSGSSSDKTDDRRKATKDSTPVQRMRTRGIKLDFVSMKSGKKSVTKEPEVEEKKKSLDKRKDTVQHQVTPRRVGRPPKKLSMSHSTESSPAKKKRVTVVTKADKAKTAVLPRKRKVIEVSDGDSESDDDGKDSAEPEAGSAAEDKNPDESDVKPSTKIRPVPDGVHPVLVRKRGRPPKHKTDAIVKPRTPQRNIESFIKELGWKNDFSDYDIVANLTEKYGKNYHVLMEPYECGACGELFAQLDPMKEHMDSKHQDGNTDPQNTLVLPSLFKCAACTREFRTAEELKDHCLTHGSKKDYSFKMDTLQDPKLPSTCSICGRTVSSLKELAKHILNVHQDSRTYECEICHKKFGCHWYLREHKVMHNSSYSYICEYCGWPYKRQYDYKMHLLTHTGKGFLCNVCGMECKTQYNLKLHKYDAHKDFEEFQCLICYKTVKANKHVLKHCCIKPRREHLLKEKIDKSGRPFYVCQTCGESFNRKSHLAVHMLKLGHLPLKPGELAKRWRIAKIAKGQQNDYTCPNCEMSFLTSRDAKSHIESEICINQPRPVTEEELKRVVQEENVALLTDTKLVRCKEPVMDQSVFCSCPKCHCLLSSLTILRQHTAYCLGSGGDHEYNDTAEPGEDNGDTNNKIYLILNDGQTVPGNDLPEYNPVNLGPRAQKFVKRHTKKIPIRRPYGQNRKVNKEEMTEMTVTEKVIQLPVEEAQEEEATFAMEKTVIPTTTYLCAVCNSMFLSLEDVHSHMKNEHEADVDSLASSEPQTLLTSDTLIFTGIDQDGADVTFDSASGVVYTTSGDSDVFAQE